MSYEHLKEIAKKLVPHALFEKIYYCQTGVKLTLGLREIKSTQDIAEMMKVGYESGNEIDMYVEHFGYDIMELIKLEVNEEHNHNSIEESDDEYYGSDDYEEIENVDFQTEGDESVMIKSISTHDPFLTKLCSARIMFRGTAEHLQTEEPLADPDDHQIHAVNKVQSGVLYPAFDPDIPWDKMEPTLGMRYETPYQLKLALANYGVAHGYQLWYMKNDWREVLVYCGRNVEEGRCAGKKGNKDRVMKNKVRSGVQTGVKKKVVKKKVLKKKVVKKKPVSDSGEGTSQSPKWTKKQIRDSKQVVYPFRMYASWMSNEHSLQIKSLNSEHKYCRNYNWDLLQALLDSNPGSTCRLDVEESSNGSTTFKRIYICFKEVKDGWLLGCRKVIVRVENADNWGWFLHLLHDDLSLNNKNGITIISDSHKGLIDAVNDWLPEAEHRKCTRHIYDNFKKKYNEGAYDYLIKRNPNSWSRAFFEMDMRCAAFENGISESINRAILEPRHKPIITMLEEIRSYGGGDEEYREDEGRREVGNGEQCRGRRGSGRGNRAVGSNKRWNEGLGQLDEEAFRECMEEQAREQAKNDVEQERLDKEIREEIEWEEKNNYFNPANFREDSLEEAPFNHTYAEVLIPSIHSQPTNTRGDLQMKEELPAPAADKGKGVASVAQQDSAPKKKRGSPPSHVDGVKIYHKNRGRSERIYKMKEKKAFEFDKHRTGSTPDKAFDVSD
ncbi:F-box domain containing protein [Tanacetum coccineum]|uniref:F-box domain containing protein n=1 Tax=Tanacetum coccineum TaxID=301880 RepID=A0ABQ5I615_9ASTR